MSYTYSQQQAVNVLLVEVPPQFIALCEASGASPQAALRGMAAMLCGLRRPPAFSSGAVWSPGLG